MKKSQILKSDGYIKEQKIRLKAERKTILCKFFVISILFLIFIGIFSLILTREPPDKWEHKKITFQKLSYEEGEGFNPLSRYSGSRKIWVMYGTDGSKYTIPRRHVKDKNMNAFAEKLSPNQQYEIVYSEDYYKNVKAMYSDDEELISLDTSVDIWRSDRTSAYISILVLFVLMIICDTLGWIFWCKKQRVNIKKIKTKISARINKKIKK